MTFLRSAVALFVALLLSVAPLAMADEGSFQDPNDTPGKLDIRSVSQAHSMDEEGSELFVHTIRTFGPWQSRLLRRDATHFILSFDTDGDGERDRGAGIGYRNGRLGASMSKLECDGDVCSGEDLGDVKVRRLSRRSVRVWLPAGMMSDEVIPEYTWWVDSSFLNKSDPRCDEYYECSDTVPNEGTLTHSL